MRKKLIVIGAGMASGRVLEHLFEAGADYDVTLFNAEPRGNYNRIMLSPVLSGDKTYAEIVTHDADWYAQNNVMCRFGERIASIDRDVTVVHIMGHLMERQLDEAAGYLLRRALVDKGITVKCAANSKEILGEDGKVRALLLDDGTELPCDLLVMAVGIRPNVKLAQDSGLMVGKGIHVDDQMITSDVDVLAVGEWTKQISQTCAIR